ncbi:Helix-turn-helix domain-containing protein [Cnuella takakiae]|uniref:Helix-turn-helix domain-containing protein n=1 Tax=Cnuella takakiae TaxID=1302690 RepID=A0A1M4SCX6_9BACT|nr:helix-turn-helix domain-containing protein [Cnuella takakiae]SHE29877.1 Helix-turn-helix domain-containing protein [Cnuella takakiae]
MKREQTPILLPYDPEEFLGQIRAIIREEFANMVVQRPLEPRQEPFIPRREVANLLRVSLVTLNSWVKKGMPAHKQQGKLYFLQSEVMNYIRKKT